MLKILILVFFISNIFANETYLIVEENKQLISKEKDISILLKEGHIYYKKTINSNNKYELLINEAPNNKIEIIRYENIYAIEINKSQVNITYLLFKKIKNQLIPLNIRITNPIFRNEKIFSYYRDSATWFLDIYCDKNRIYKCGEGILYPNNIEEDIFITKINNKIEFFTFDARNEKIKSIKVKNQKNSGIPIIDYKNEEIGELKLKINNEWINSKKVKIFLKKLEITKSKQYLFDNPHKNSKTKMYLIKGDNVKILKEKDNWLYILFKGKKEIKAWIPKNALEKEEIKEPVKNIEKSNTLKKK